MNSSYLLVNFLEKHNASVWMHKLNYKERLYTKRDAFVLMNCDKPYYYNTNQFMAGIQIYKKTNFTVKFIQEWLNYCQDERIITDKKNVMGKKNYPGFIENRHDQTILSLLIKKYGIANSGSPNISLDEINQIKRIIMPNILCIYRRTKFKDYIDIKQKCKKIIENQEHIFK